MTVTSWSTGKSLRVTDLAVASSVSQSTQYSPSPSSLSPERPLKERETQKATKYSTLVESQGGDFSPLVTGTSGYVASPAKKLLRVAYSSQDARDYGSSRYSCEFWMTKISLSLQKSVASEILVRSKKANGRLYTSFLSRGTFPDSLGTHPEVSG